MINIDFNNSLKNEIKNISNNRKDIESCGLIYFDEKTLKFNI